MANFIHAVGVNGFIKTPFQLFTAADTGLNALGNGLKVTSANGGALANGIFSQSDFANAQYVLLWLQIVTAGMTPTAGGNLSGWWLNSPDGGATFETMEATASATVPALGRPPDWTINLYEGGAALAATDKKFSAIVPAPYPSCKAVIQNNSGVTFGAGAHLLFCGPVADTYG